MNDASRFADACAANAAALNWSVLDVSGINARAPDARYYAMGSVPLLAGEEAIAIAPDTAKVRHTPSGKVLTYYRRPHVGAVTLWELGG